MNKKILLPVLILATLSSAPILVYGIITRQTDVFSSAVVASVGLGVYSNISCDKPLASLDWGMLYPGSDTAKGFYVRNEGTLPLTLTISATDWSPANVLEYLTLTFDYPTYAIQSNGVVEISLTMHITLSIKNINSFSFNICIVSTEASI